MKICILTSSYPINRQDYIQAPFLLDFVKILMERGHRVFIYTQNRKGRKEAVINGVEVKWFNWRMSSKRIVDLSPFNPLDILNILSLIHNGRSGLPKFIEEQRIDVCLALWIIPNGYFAYCAHKKIGVPYSVWMLGSDVNKYGGYPVVRGIMKEIIVHATSIFANGFKLSQKVERLFHRECHFLATTRKLPDVEEDAKIDSSRGYNFLFVGRLTKVKGVDILIRGVKLLRKDALEMRLWIVGDGPLRNYIKREIFKENLAENIVLLGAISDEELVSLYRKCNCVIIPSRSESNPLVLSEALNFGKDLIVSDVGDMGYLAREYGIAEVIPPEDPFVLKEVMKKMILGEVKMDREKYKDKYARLKQLFNIQMSVDQFLSSVEKKEVFS